MELRAVSQPPARPLPELNVYAGQGKQLVTYDGQEGVQDMPIGKGVRENHAVRGANEREVNHEKSPDGPLGKTNVQPIDPSLEAATFNVAIAANTKPPTTFVTVYKNPGQPTGTIADSLA